MVSEVTIKAITHFHPVINIRIVHFNYTDDPYPCSEDNCSVTQNYKFHKNAGKHVA